MSTAATAPALRVVRGSDTVEVYGEARLSLTKGEAYDLIDELRRALGRRRQFSVAVQAYKLGVRFGLVLAKAKRLRGAR